MEVLDIERALADLRLAVKISPNADSAERATAADYQMMINLLEEMLVDVDAPHPDIVKLTALLSEVQRILETVMRRLTEQLSTAARKVAAGEPIDGLFSRHSQISAARAIIDELSKKIVAAANRRTKEIGAASQPALPGQYDLAQDSFILSVHEAPTQYAASNAPASPEPGAGPKADARNIDVTRVVTDITRRLGDAIESHPDSKATYVPVLQQLVELSLHLITSNQGQVGAPPRGPVDTSRKRGEDDDMDSRLTALEKFADECRKDLRSIDVRLGKVETLLDGISKNMATKADTAEIKVGISQLESAMLKWFIGTALTAAALAVAAAKLIA